MGLLVGDRVRGEYGEISFEGTVTCTHYEHEKSENPMWGVRACVKRDDKINKPGNGCNNSWIVILDKKTNKWMSDFVGGKELINITNNK